MDGLLKNIVFLALGVVALFIIATISFVLIFDPNDFRDDIAEEMKRNTGRELVIEGDLSVSYFPWFAINVGKTTLGNAPGFGDEPFVSFEQATLSVSVLPMLLNREIAVGTATLDSLQLNLSVASNGRSNWQDLIEAGENAEVDTAEATEADSAALKIASIEIRNASVSYSDAQVGESYRLDNFDLVSGSIVAGEPIALSSNFDFELQPADLAGDFSIETMMALDIGAGTVAFTDVDINVLGVDIAADVAPYSYVDGEAPTAVLAVAEFSLKSLMQRLQIEAPVTADPDVLGKVIIDATVQINEDATDLTDLVMILDDTTFKGDLSLAQDAAGTIRIELAADSIDVDRYMEPATEGTAGGDDDVPVEIPVDLIRSLNVRGSLTVAEAQLGGMRFENVELGLNAANGNMRLRPISADLFDGKYQGDVSVNASAATPVLSVNENISNVNLGALAVAMFEQEDVTGTINGSFRLSGAGNDLAAIQRDLNGSISMELIDGAWEGTDVWYEIRRARALYKQEPAPEPVLPARTPFSVVNLAGPVTKGVFRSNDLRAELPFMLMTGKGNVDLATTEIDYRLSARVLDSPEFMSGATEEELEEFTEAVIPLKVSGPLADPSIVPDIEEMLKEEAKEQIKERLLEELFGDDDESDEETSGEEPKEKKKSDSDRIKDALKDLLGD